MFTMFTKCTTKVQNKNWRNRVVWRNKNRSTSKGRERGTYGSKTQSQTPQLSNDTYPRGLVTLLAHGLEDTLGRQAIGIRSNSISSSAVGSQGRLMVLAASLELASGCLKLLACDSLPLL